jgi:tetratricopeptide (TPR) repeat protein
LHAQGGVDQTGTGGRHSILGRIYFPSGVRADSRLKVRLESTRYQELSVLADSNGSFGFKSLLPGSYTVVVEGGDEYETVRETVYIDGEASRPRSGLQVPSAARAYQVQVHLQGKRIMQANARPGVVNAALAGIPELARRSYEKSLELSQGGDSKKAIEELKRAISFYPMFPLALNELGVQYLKIGQLDSALDALSRAVKLDPASPHARLNYGIALLQKKNFPEAKAQLSEALKRNSSMPTAHLYMGITQIQAGRFNEAEQAFLRAIELGKQNVGLAHYYLGGLYWRRGEHKLAADQLEKYLATSPSAHEAEKIKATIKELRSKQG